MITASTENKLFKIKTFDSNEPYKIGYNGVTDIINDGNIVTIKYKIDNILYTTFYDKDINEQNKRLDNITFTEFKEFNNKSNSFNSNISVKDQNLNITKSFSTIEVDNNVFRKRIKKLNNLSSNSDGYLGDTIVETKKNSYEKFVKKKIFKKDRFIGFVAMPEVKSEILIERDELTVFERHQRLSEINNLAELETYRNGYYKIVNTI